MMAPMSRNDRTFLGLGAFGVAIAALCVALFGLRDSGNDNAESASGAGGEAAAATDVNVVNISLSEFKIAPQMPDLPTGPTQFVITNDGTQVHNLSLPSLGLKTPDINPGDTYTLDLGALPAGDFDMKCEIPGHSDAGMTGVVHTEDGLAAPTGDGTGEGTQTTMDWRKMDELMEDVAKQYPAKTEGHGGDLMPYTVAEDGYKVFDVTAKIVQWEVTPGNFVEAWTYNGVVPGPEIHVEVGDKVRVVLHNDLPESTSLHFHGIRVPNAMDGVDPYTQPAQEPGTTYTYEFEALEVATGIYHSHHDAQMQIPNGMFGAFTVGGFEVPEYLVEKGYDNVVKKVNMVLNDAGTIGLSLNGKAFPATEPYTLRIGEVMEVTYYNEGLLGHPMHMHQPVGWIIAKDGYALEQPLPADTIWVSPSERYTVLYKATDPGVWAWHCHILTHAEGSTGMLGMVTALIVTE